MPFFRGTVNDGPLPEVNPSDYFGYRNLDYQETTVDRATATFTHEASPALTFRNLTRWQRVRQDSVTSAPQGAFCLTGTGRQPVGGAPTATTGLACVSGSGASAITIPAGTFLPSGPRGLGRDQENQLFYNQTDLRLTHGEKGGVRNILNVGVQFGWEDYQITSSSLLRNAAGVATAPLPFISLSNPDTVYAGPVNRFTTAFSKGESRNVAVYAFDTLELGKFELNGGVRWESVDATFRGVPLLAPPPGTLALTPAQAAPQHSYERLLSYRVGAVFKPTDHTSLYVAYGNSKTPSSATVRLGCGTISAPGAADPCASAPEKARSYEIGAKADIGGMQLTAAAFRNERSNFRVPSNDPGQLAQFQVLDGRSRVDGIALGATGSPIEGLTLFANYTYLDSEVLQSVSDFCLANPRASCLNSNPANYPLGSAAGSVVIPDPQAGDRLIQTPKHSGSLFASYRTPFGLEIGYGLTYQGSFALNQRTLLGRTQFRSDDFMTHRAFLSYTLREGLTAQLNVQNLFDKKYYTNIRNNIGTALTGATANNGNITGGWAMPGERRSAVLSLFYSF